MDAEEIARFMAGGHLRPDASQNKRKKRDISKVEKDEERVLKKLAMDEEDRSNRTETSSSGASFRSSHKVASSKNEEELDETDALQNITIPRRSFSSKPRERSGSLTGSHSHGSHGRLGGGGSFHPHRPLRHRPPQHQQHSKPPKPSKPARHVSIQSDGGGKSDESTPSNDLVEQALEVCRGNGLGDHLNWIDIGQLRLTCKTTGKIAARMAQNRMQGISFLECRIKVDGMDYYDPHPSDIPEDKHLWTRDDDYHMADRR